MLMIEETETTMLNQPPSGDHIGGYLNPLSARPPKRHHLRMAVVLPVVTLLCLATTGLSHAVASAAALPSLSSPSAAVAPWALPAVQPPSPSLADVAPGAPHRGWHPQAPPTNFPPVNSSSPSSVSLDLSALASKVDPAVVDINTVLSTPNNQAAGTGVVLDPSGVVLTNNHVISGATSITVTDIGNSQTYPATVIGYDHTHDIALLQLQNASGLPTAEIGDSGAVVVGDGIAAIGNAGGRGGTPTLAAGTVTALNQTVTVSDAATGNTEQLAGLIQVAANVQPGDSGGPLVNSTGQVIGIDTAGSTGSHWRSDASGGEGLAIPINDAIAISKQIQAGTVSPTVHIGLTGIIGITVQGPNAQSMPTQRGRFRSRHHFAIPTIAGALVTGIMPGSPAEQSGLIAGDVIVSLDATPVDSPTTLTTLVTAHHPGDSINLAWVDPTGQQHTATIQLAAGPPN
jgi:S1-C subfamily serine protease